MVRAGRSSEKGAPACQHPDEERRRDVVAGPDDTPRAERVRHHEGYGARPNEEAAGSRRRPDGAVTARAPLTGLGSDEPPGH
ncbi:hypothetical protein ACKI1J_19805 [Streptomyces scabiei]|uniref:hypothetical protein n=1 Tax=Streptomyces scabiei TaxID=1930 RepID=UPI0038F7CD11